MFRVMAQQIKLTREELYRRVWEKPTTKLAAEFGISDVGLAKICRKMDVPKPPLGYWRRIETGETIKPTPLPKATSETKEFVYLNVPVSDGSNKVDPEIQAMIDHEDLPENQIKIAEDFEDAHPVVKKTKQFYDETNIEQLVPISPPKGKGYLNISVSRSQSRRALLIMDAIFKAGEKLGYIVDVEADHWGEETRIVKEGEEVRISLYEKTYQVKRELTPEEKKKPPYLLNIPTEYQADGKLTVKINVKWSHYQKWSDRKNEPLETRLNDVVASIIALLETLVAEKGKRQEEERQRQEALRRREEERHRRETLEADASEWRNSQDIKAYLDAYETRLMMVKGGIYPDSSEARWLSWARDYAARLDPLNKIFSDSDENSTE